MTIIATLLSVKPASLRLFPVPEVLATKINEGMARSSALPLPSGLSSASFKVMSTRQRPSHRRFYKAVTRHWISVKLLWLVRTQSFPNAGGFDKAFDRTCGMRNHNPMSSVSYKIDMTEVVYFV